MPGQPLQFDQAILDQFPSGYRHLAYLQAAEGFQVKRDLPGLTGPATDKLYAEGKQWLAAATFPGSQANQRDLRWLAGRLEVLRVDSVRPARPSSPVTRAGFRVIRPSAQARRRVRPRGQYFWMRAGD